MRVHLLVVVFAAGCGGSVKRSAPRVDVATAPACATAPFSCAAGTTCTQVSSDAGFACLPEGDFAPGERCLAGSNASTCLSGSMCILFTTDTLPSQLGLCRSLCDDSHPCASSRCTCLARVETICVCE